MKMSWIQAVVIVLAMSVGAMAAEKNMGETPMPHEAEQQSIFSGSLADSIWTVVAFVILTGALGKLAWKPLINGLKEREERIRSEITTAENARRQAEKTLAEYNGRVEQLEQQGRQITEKAAKEAQKQAREIAEKARQEALAVKQKAQGDIEAAHAAAKEQLWQDAGEIALVLGGHVLGKNITDEDNQRLVREAIGKLKVEN